MGHVMLFSFDINPSEPSKFIYFNMPLFFYISGYLAYKNFYTLHELGKRILQRGIVLLFPYLIFLCLYEIFTNGTDWDLSIIYCGGQRYWFLYDLFILSTFFLVYEYLIKRVRSNFAYVALWILPYFSLIAAKTEVSKIGGLTVKLLSPVLSIITAIFSLAIFAKNTYASTICFLTINS